jgi:hypothetical protein
MGIVTGIVSMPWEINHGPHPFSKSITYAHPPPLSKMILRDQHLHLHSIKVPFINLFWNVTDSSDHTKVRLLFYFKKSTFFLSHYKSRLPSLMGMALTIRSGPPAPLSPLATVLVPKFPNVSLQGNVGE